MVKKSVTEKFLSIPCPRFLTEQEFESIKDFLVAKNIYIYKNTRKTNAPKVSGVFEVYALHTLRNNKNLHFPVDIYRFYACLKLFGLETVHTLLINLSIPRTPENARCWKSNNNPADFEKHIKNILEGEYLEVETNREKHKNKNKHKKKIESEGK